MIGPWLVNEWQCAHGVEGCEKMGMAFFKMSSSCASRLLAVRSARISAALTELAGKGYWAAFCWAQSRLRSMFKARAAANVERLSLTIRRASARKAAS